MRKLIENYIDVIERKFHENIFNNASNLEYYDILQL